jgi:hypothetical protein
MLKLVLSKQIECTTSMIVSVNPISDQAQAYIATKCMYWCKYSDCVCISIARLYNIVKWDKPETSFSK